MGVDEAGVYLLWARNNSSYSSDKSESFLLLARPALLAGCATTYDDDDDDDYSDGSCLCSDMSLAGETQVQNQTLWRVSPNIFQIRAIGRGFLMQQDRRGKGTVTITSMMR